MTKFEFDFRFQGYDYAAECQAFSIDGSTALHVTPLDDDIFENFGVRILLLTSDGSIEAEVPALTEEKDYILALADGLADYFNNEQQSTN